MSANQWGVQSLRRRFCVMGQRPLRAYESPHRQKARSARIFWLLAEGGAVPKPVPTITAVFAPRNFSVDSRNENLPKKRSHQNYAEGA
jgi:hypothetical protein